MQTQQKQTDETILKHPISGAATFLQFKGRVSTHDYLWGGLPQPNGEHIMREFSFFGEPSF